MVKALATTGRSPACDPGNPNAPRVAVRAEWLRGMTDGLFKLPDNSEGVQAWSTCVVDLLASQLEPVQRGASVVLLDALEDVLESRRRRKHVHGLEALRLAFLATRASDGLAPNALAPLAELAKRREKTDSEPRRAAYGRWIATLELARGLDEGRRVTKQAISETTDEGKLDRFERLLPTSTLRRQAAERIVFLRLEESAYPELLAVSAEVTSAVLDRGRYEPDLGRFSPIRLAVDADVLPEAFALSPEPGFRRYAASPRVAGELHHDAPIPLGRSLRVYLEGLAEPVMLCRDQRRFDPTPCLAPENLVSTLGRWRGLDYFAASRLRPRQAIDLATAGSIELAFSIGGRTLNVGSTPVVVAVPPPMRFGAEEYASTGPELLVGVSRPHDDFFFFSVNTEGEEHFALVPTMEVNDYEVVTRGGEGQPGLDGRPGRPGYRGADGRDAVCPDTSGGDGTDGGDGGPGGDGQPGGDGGDGGVIRVLFDCAPGRCPPLRELRGIQSLGGLGGRGGEGGPGGAGGLGGRGGSSADCDDSDDDKKDKGGWATFFSVLSTIASLNGGSDGDDGRRGPDGRPGISGTPGSPAPVQNITPGKASSPMFARRRAPAESVFVLDVQRFGGVEPGVAQLLAERLLTALRSLGYRSVGMADLTALLDNEQRRELIGCDDVTCMAEIAGAMDTDFLLRTNVGRVEGRLTIHLALLERTDARARARLGADFDSVDETLDAIEELLRSVFDG
ncbi:MAG: hypothetical protein AAFZ38_06305 [Myxococcota bacterium]